MFMYYEQIYIATHGKNSVTNIKIPSITTWLQNALELLEVSCHYTKFYRHLITSIVAT